MSETETVVAVVAPARRKAANQKKPLSVRIQRNDGSVAEVAWDEAFSLNQRGKAAFISRTLFKAAQAGLDIKKLKGKTDAEVKAMIKAKNKPERPEKKNKD